MTLQLTTAGESHGPALTAILEGLPRGLKIDESYINAMLQRRQGGVGRGGRQKLEHDKVLVTAGLRSGMTFGDPLCLVVENRDSRLEKLKPMSIPRPGHADYAGMVRFRSHDLNNIAERASARNTTVTTAAGAVTELLLKEMGIEVLGYVQSIGGIFCDECQESLAEIRSKTLSSEVYCPDKEISKKMVERIAQASEAKDTLGGSVIVIAEGLPVGLGSVMTQNERLDGRLAGALMALPAVKGVEIGDGFSFCDKVGRDVMDELKITNDQISHQTNHGGGLEGGMSNGSRLRIRLAKKPISTQRDPLKSVDLKLLDEAGSEYYRSDVTAVPALSVIAQAVTAFELAKAFLETFGGPHLTDVKKRLSDWKGRGAIDL